MVKNVFTLGPTPHTAKLGCGVAALVRRSSSPHQSPVSPSLPLSDNLLREHHSNVKHTRTHFGTLRPRRVRRVVQEDGEGFDGQQGKTKDTGKGKDAAGGKSKGGGEEKGAKGKGKPGKEDLGTCTYVKARHILCEKQGKINEAYKKLQEGWLESGDKVPPAEFAKLAAEYSECPSGKKGGDLGWFPRGKMAGPFQEVAFNTPPGILSAPFKSTHGYHIILAEGRKS